MLDFDPMTVSLPSHRSTTSPAARSRAASRLSRIHIFRAGPASPCLRLAALPVLLLVLLFAGCAAPGHELTVDIRGGHHPAEVVELPFYSRSP